MAPGATDHERETLAVLNAILRHHVRNHLTVIRGRAQWLGRNNANTDDIETIRRHCDEMAATVDHIEAITNSLELAGSERKLDVGAFVGAEIVSLRDLYDVTFTLDIEAPETTATADELFSFVLREMCTNVVASTGETEPSVRVTVDATAESVVVTVSSETAGGVPDSLSTDPFTTTARAGGTDDYGLFLSDAILSRYGGKIEFDESDAGAFRIRASIPRANPD